MKITDTSAMPANQKHNPKVWNYRPSRIVGGCRQSTTPPSATGAIPLECGSPVRWTELRGNNYTTHMPFHKPIGLVPASGSYHGNQAGAWSLTERRDALLTRQATESCLVVWQGFSSKFVPEHWHYIYDSIPLFVDIWQHGLGSESQPFRHWGKRCVWTAGHASEAHRSLHSLTLM